MKATFNIKVEIDSTAVSTSFGSEKIEDMDTTLLASVLKVFGDVSNRVKKQVAQFYGVQKDVNDSIPANERRQKQLPHHLLQNLRNQSSKTSFAFPQ